MDDVELGHWRRCVALWVGVSALIGSKTHGLGALMDDVELGHWRRCAWIREGCVS